MRKRSKYRPPAVRAMPVTLGHVALGVKHTQLMARAALDAMVRDEAVIENLHCLDSLSDHYLRLAARIRSDDTVAAELLDQVDPILVAGRRAVESITARHVAKGLVRSDEMELRDMKAMMGAAEELDKVATARQVRDVLREQLHAMGVRT